MTPSNFAALQQRIDAAKRKCSTGYSCGAGCISMKKQCRKTPGGAEGKAKVKRVLALAAGKEGGPETSGGARPKALPPAGGSGGSPAATQKAQVKGGGGGSADKPVTTKELRDPVLKYFGVKTPAELLANKDFAMATDGDPPRTFKGKAAAGEWRQLHRMFAGVPRDERGLKEGGSVINGIDVMKNFRPWHVFKLDPKKATKGDVDKAFRSLAKKHHPDVGGDREVFEKLGTMRTSLNAFFRDAPPPKKKKRTDAGFADWLEVRLDALRARCGAMNG